MLILAIETSTQAGSIALVEAPSGEELPTGEKLLGEYLLDLPRTHSERLMPSIDRLLQDTSLSINRVQGIAISLGPGSFTGLRIGVAAAKGLAYALRIPVVGISTLEALANNIPYATSLICPVLDARKKEVYAALFRGNGQERLQKISEDWILPPEDLCSRISEETIFLGNGIETYGAVLRGKLGSNALFAPSELSTPRAASVARLSLSQFKKGLSMDLFSFTPIYIRRSEAEIQYEAKEKIA